MFLHVAFARLAANDDTTHEFETKYDPNSETIELLIPDKFLELLENTDKGPRFRRYINWLFESSGYWEYDEDNDVLVPTSKVCFNNYAGYSELIDNGSSGSSSEVDWSLGNKQTIVLTDNTTFTFIDPPCSSTSLQIIVKQDSTGGRTVSWPSNVKFPNGVLPPYTTTADAIDVWSFLWDGEFYYGTIVPNFQSVP